MEGHKQGGKNGWTQAAIGRIILETDSGPESGLEPCTYTFPPCMLLQSGESCPTIVGFGVHWQV